MPVSSKFLVTTASFLAAAIAVAVPARAQGLKQVGSIAIPGGPINSRWVVFIDQASALGYLADKDNKSVATDHRHRDPDSYVGRITGFTARPAAARPRGRTASSPSTTGPSFG